ncbi:MULTISPECIES: hypothetical protein [unclassified Methylobacterium]|uniref:hypothetical protein n=1 Tax=unclassified Methylobacterium TaxID=2615210 RepID=UPI001FBB7862|nr:MULTISPECIES: hypothetical protein [unclassified Methylobacterium]MCJ2022539.1 hypothetical protein [Methylobacterium sp. E-065]
MWGTSSLERRGQTMTRKIIEAPDFGTLGFPTAPGFDAPMVQAPIVTPGDVADQSGDLWLDVLGDRLVHGELAVTPEQANAAARYGWAAVPNSEHAGKITVRRSDPHPDQD